MDARRMATVYGEYVVAHGLERTAMLETIASTLPAAPAVLYPGCFIHTTPSFYFQHVVYVDRNELAADYFSQLDAVVAAVGRRKRYPQRPYLRFIQADYTRPLPLTESSFDLVLALSSGHVAEGCASYLKPGGVLLADDELADARRAAQVPGLELAAVMLEQRGKLRVVAADARCLAMLSTPPAETTRAGRASYYLFRRTRPAKDAVAPKRVPRR